MVSKWVIGPICSILVITHLHTSHLLTPNETSKQWNVTRFAFHSEESHGSQIHGMSHGHSTNPCPIVAFKDNIEEEGDYSLYIYNIHNLETKAKLYW